MNRSNDFEEVLGELVCDFAWGFFWSSLLTYPITTYLFPVAWSKLSLGTAAALLGCTWLGVTLVVQSIRARRNRKWH